MSYRTVSHTGSGWEISHDPGAPSGEQWRIRHAQWGTKFFDSHDQARDEAFRIAFEKCVGCLVLSRRIITWARRQRLV
jgi:hypothetical protein